MAFTKENFIPLSASANSNAQKVYQYAEGTTLVLMRAANYFNSAVSYGLQSGDAIMLFGTDGFGFSTVAVAANGNVTVSESITSA